MKYQDLKKEKENNLTKLMKDCDVFFAFSEKQFEENKTPLAAGEKYVAMGAGGYAPKSKFKIFNDGYNKFINDFNKSIIENKLQEEEIIYELRNHEAFYTYELEDTFEALNKKYTMEEIKVVFDKFNQDN